MAVYCCHTLFFKGDFMQHKLVQEFFEKTGIKVSDDDPTIQMIELMQTTLKNSLSEAEDSFKKMADDFVIQTKGELDWANEYFVGNTEIHKKSLDELFEKVLGDMDTKNKDLLLILSKIQAEYDKANDERFERHIASIEALHAKELQRQNRKDTAKQREILFAGAGFAAGIVICLLIFFIVR